MLFYCAFTWYPTTTRRAVAERTVAQHDAGANRPERYRGWYDLVGGGAGFLVIEADRGEDITAILSPYSDLMSWDVRAVTANDYDAVIAGLRREIGAGS